MIRNSLLIFFFALISFHTYGQEIIDLAKTKFETPEDYRKGEIIVLKCVDILFSRPIDSDEGERILATKIIYAWIVGTPDYLFQIEEWISKITGKDPHLMGLYLGGLAAYAIENGLEKGDNATMQIEVAKKIIRYIQDKGNNVQMNRPIRKLRSAYEKNKLLEFLDLEIE